MFQPKLTRNFYDRGAYASSYASIMSSRQRASRQDGGFLQALIPIATALAPTVIDLVSGLFKKRGNGFRNKKQGRGVSRYQDLITQQTKYNPTVQYYTKGPTKYEMMPMRLMNRGSGLADGLRKLVGWIKPAISKGWELAKNIIPKIAPAFDTFKQVVTDAKPIYSDAKILGSDAWQALKNRDFNKIGDIYKRGKEIYDRSEPLRGNVKDLIDQGKTGYKSIRDILKEKETINKDVQAKSLENIVRESAERTMNQFQQMKNTLATNKSAEIQKATDGAITAVETGSGLVRSMMNRNTRSMMTRNKRRGMYGAGFIEI